MGKPHFKHVSPPVEHSMQIPRILTLPTHTQATGSGHTGTVRLDIYVTVRNKNKTTFREKRAIIIIVIRYI